MIPRVRKNALRSGPSGMCWASRCTRSGTPVALRDSRRTMWPAMGSILVGPVDGGPDVAVLVEVARLVAAEGVALVFAAEVRRGQGTLLAKATLHNRILRRFGG